MAILGDVSCAATRRHFLNNVGGLVADCFPQKDNAARRVFKDAKLSTAVLTGLRRSQRELATLQLDVRVYPWNSFADEPRRARITGSDLALFDPENLPVPLVSGEQLALCRKIHGSIATRRLGDVEHVEVNRGEINQTIYRAFITSDSRHSRLLKGVEIGRYCLRETLKQGRREWLDEQRFLEECGPRVITTRRRIATQRITGVDERWRIVATILPAGVYFADSTNSIAVADDSPLPLEYFLAFLNSRLWQWRFKLTSSNNNVGTNELKCMPLFCPRESNAKTERAALVAHVERMLKLHADLAAAKTPDAQTRMQREIAATDRTIDALVYELYELTPEEIRLVEEATAPQARATPEPDASAADETPPAAPPPPTPTPVPYHGQAEADAAHFYFAKEDPPTSS